MFRTRYVVAAFAAASLLLAGTSAFRPTSADAMKTSPATGWTVHIDAKKHFGDAHPNEIAHHWCKPTAGGMLECQIYDSDAANAHLVAVETIVSPAVYKTFDDTEKAMWHYHKDEIPKVSATMPDMTPAEAKKMTAQITETYGKIFVLWDPLTSKTPIGNPSVTILK